MNYTFSQRSLQQLVGVHPRLERCVHRALEVTTTDFMVFDGLRTEEEQRQNVLRGVSQTMNSKHLPQADGHSHAVDLVAWRAGSLRWDLESNLPVARAMQRASRELRVPVRWGGAWVTLADASDDLEDVVAAYVHRRRTAGRRPFVDAFHFEIIT
jgi:peptidoglycan L-alanyl-D-glutamate endopeptidase CwlK